MLGAGLPSRRPPPLGQDQVHPRGRGDRQVVQPHAVKRIDKPRGVSHQHEAVVGGGLADVGQVPPDVLVALDQLGIAEQLPAHGVGLQHLPQLLAQARARRPRPTEQPLVPRHAHRGLAVAQRDDPGPPPLTHDVVGRGVPGAVKPLAQLRETPGQVRSVEVQGVTPARPDCRGGVALDRPNLAPLPCDHGLAARRVDDPPRPHPPGLLPGIPDRQRLQPAGVQLDLADLRRPPHLAPRLADSPQHLFVQHRPIHLVRRDPREVSAAHLRGPAHVRRPFVGKPVPEALFDDVVLHQVPGQPQRPGEEIRGQLHRRLADPPGKRLLALDDQHPQVGLLPEQRQRRARPRQRAADHRHIEHVHVVTSTGQSVSGQRRRGHRTGDFRFHEEGRKSAAKTITDFKISAQPNSRAPRAGSVGRPSQRAATPRPLARRLAVTLSPPPPAPAEGDPTIVAQRLRSEAIRS